MVAKWPLIAIIDQGPSFRVCSHVLQTFYGSEREYDKQKVARVNGQGKTVCTVHPDQKKVVAVKVTCGR